MTEIFELLKRIYCGEATKDDIDLYKNKFMSETEKQIGKPYFEMNDAEKLACDAISLNATPGKLTGYDCPLCKNKGYIMLVGEDGLVTHKCKCLTTRNTLRRMEASGFGNLLDLYTFENWTYRETWQKYIYDSANEFLNAKANAFYIGGQSGCGKTMICTAMAKELIKQGKEVRYMLWLDDGLKLKQAKTNEETYNSLIEPFKRAEVLYIDDFLKVGKNEAPTTADINLAMEILNFRYVRSKASKERLITIISSERSIEEILGYDEATGGRIIEMTQPNFYLFIEKEKNKNFRLKGSEQ